MTGRFTLQSTSDRISGTSSSFRTIPSTFTFLEGTVLRFTTFAPYFSESSSYPHNFIVLWSCLYAARSASPTNISASGSFLLSSCNTASNTHGEVETPGIIWSAMPFILTKIFEPLTWLSQSASLIALLVFSITFSFDTTSNFTKATFGINNQPILLQTLESKAFNLYRFKVHSIEQRKILEYAKLISFYFNCCL